MWWQRYGHHLKNDQIYELSNLTVLNGLDAFQSKIANNSSSKN